MLYFQRSQQEGHQGSWCYPLLVYWPLSLLLSDKEITVFHMGFILILKNPKHEYVSQGLGEIGYVFW